MRAFDVDRLLEAMRKAGYGTGTLSASAGLSPDRLQRIIATGRAEPEEVERLVGLLGSEWGAPESVEVPAEAPALLRPETAADVISAVERGAVSREDALAAERARHSGPRLTVLKALEKPAPKRKRRRRK